jgi:aldehyde dehydrogenase (NAD+)
MTVSPSFQPTQPSQTFSASAAVQQCLQTQRSHFATGITKPLAYRRAQLLALKTQILAATTDFNAALKADLGKCEWEAFMGEISLVTGEIDHALKHLDDWNKTKAVPVGLTSQPAKAQIVPEPLGVVLIISPWNYPFMLALGPLVSAIAAGNCAVIKPSEITPHTSARLARLIADTFEPQYISLFEGGPEVSQALLAEPFDHIFFTGSPAIGKIVMRAAAEHLTPVTLELGGKSPCVVTNDADIDAAARRIVWGKCFNAGQTCVAPDYLLVQAKIKPKLMDAIAHTVAQFFGENMANSPDYGRIVSDRHFQRLRSMMQEALVMGNCLVGGQSNADERYLAFTLIDEVSTNAAIMQEEIFGPLLPVLTFDELSEAIAFINARPKPLALYFFSNSAKQQQTIQTQTSSGSLCFNETVSQFAITELPFGGVGQSGMGSAHGKAGFDTFSHHKSVLKKSHRIELPVRYPPYGNKLDWVKKVL